MTFSAQGWAVVYGLAAVGIASGDTPEVAVERAVDLFKKMAGYEPTEESAMEAYRAMARQLPARPDYPPPQAGRNPDLLEPKRRWWR